ncbi:MAG: N-acetyltransferase family protein, partial [Chloroflexota bacterium]
MSTASPSPLLIRPAAPGDAPQLAEIQTAGGAAAGVGLLPADYLEHLLHAGKAHEHLTRPAGGQPAEAVLVAEAEAGRLAGYARVRRGSSIPAYDGELAALHVRQPDRGRGAGRQLVQAAAHWLQQAGAASLMLWAPAGSPACHFCEHLGARLIGRQSSRLDAPGQAAAGELAYGWPSLAHLLDG